MNISVGLDIAIAILLLKLPLFIKLRLPVIVVCIVFLTVKRAIYYLLVSRNSANAFVVANVP